MSLPNQVAALSRQQTHLSACGAAAITLGVAFTKGLTRAIHCNTAGTGTVYFADGTTADIVFLAGVTYDLAATRVDDSSGTPTLVALY